MSFKFAIKNTVASAIKEGEAIVRYSGVSEPFNRHSERAVKKVGVDGGGNPKLLFTTGLDEKQVAFYNWFNDEEKKIILDNIKELKPLIQDFYGGADVIEPSNTFFWKEDRNINRLSLRNENMDAFYDTDNPAHALLYLSIISGAFIDLVAPTRDWADRHQIPHYLALEIETSNYDEDDDITRSDAHAALGDLRKNHGKESLYILAWCLQYDTNSYGAYNYNTSEKSLINYHINFIDGKLQRKNKKNTSRLFMEYYDKWIKPQTRKLLYAEAYVKAGEYYNFINQREKKYTTYDGSVLGNTIPDAVKALTSQPKFHQDFEKLREQVEAKWKE